MGKLKHLIREIHERSLWQALVVYLGASFAVLEALDMVIEYFGLPRWLWPVAFVLLLVGLPFVVGSSLAHEEEYGDEVPAGAREAAAAEDQRLRVLTWRNAGITFVGALAVWGVVLSGWVLFGGWMSGEGVEAAAFDPAKRVAVLPFSFQGREEYAYLGEGMADLLSAALDGAGEWRTVNARAIEEAVRKRGDMVPGLENSRPVADQVGAGRHVVGEVVEVDGRVRISARLYGPGPEWVSANVEGTPAELFALVDDLTTQFLLATVQSTTGAHPRIAALTTDSLSALKAFLVGEVAYREGRTQDAYASYQRAVEIDSTFALAWYGLSDVAGWVEGATTAQIVRAAELAMQYRDRLPWREQRMVEANLAGWRGDADLAEGLYREVLLADPHDVEARFLLGWLLFQFNHLRGRPTVEAREHLEAVLPYEPEGWEALWFLEVIAALGGDWPAVDSLVQTRRPVMKGQALVWAAARAFALNDTAAQREVLEYHADKKPATLHWVAIVTGSFATPEGALPFTKLMAEKADSPDMRALALAYQAYLHAALGRLEEAESDLTLAGQSSPSWRLEHQGFLSQLDFVAADSLSLANLRQRLERWDVDSVRAVVHPWFYTQAHNTVHSHLRLYHLGRLSVRLGDIDAALRYADELESMSAPELGPTLPGDLARSVRAEVAVAQGRDRDALSILQDQRWVVPMDRTWGSPLRSRPHERFMRASILERLGRSEEALGWYASLGIRPYDLPYLAPSQLRQAEIYDSLGDGEKAALHYKRFIELWKDCDSELRPVVEQAERALERLTREPTTD